MATARSSRSNNASATERVEAYIRKAIFSGDFKPRQRITEESLAIVLKCSRAPIRDAILRLGRDGLLETIPRRGTFIPDVSAASIEVAFRLRGKLEGLCVRYMREVMTPAMEQTLQSILGDMRAAAQRADLEGLMEADLRLHHKIWHFSGRPEIERILTTVLNSRGFLIARTSSKWIPFAVRIDEHVDYLKIVLRSPLEAVEFEVERHFALLHTKFFNEKSNQGLLASL